MARDYPIFPDHPLTGDITSPGLARANEMRDDFSGMIAQAEQLRDALIGESERGYPFPQGKLGYALGRAGAQGNTPAVSAAVYLYVDNEAKPHQAQEVAQEFLQGLLNELISAGRRDLFRPLILAVHEACWARWIWNTPHRTAWREDHDIQNAADPHDHIPEIAERTPEESARIDLRQADRAYTYAFAGEIAWRILGEALCRLDVKDAGWRDMVPRPERLASVLEMYRDTVTTIPDARRWAESLITSVVRQARPGMDFWDIPGAFSNLMSLTALLSDSEACVVVRQINAPDGYDTPKGETYLVQKIMAARPHILLSHWLIDGMSNALRREDGKISYQKFGPQMDDIQVIMTALDSYAARHQIQNVFNRVIDHVGLDGPWGPTTELLVILQELVRWQAAEETAARYPLIGVALDKILLSEAGGQELHATPEENEQQNDIPSRRLI